MGVSATGGGQSPIVQVGDTRISSGETGTAEVVLTTAPGGLAGYEMTIAVSNPAVVTIADVAIPDDFGLTEVNLSDGGATVTVTAVDISAQIEVGRTDVRLASVELVGQASGEASLTAEIDQMDADDGSRIYPIAVTGTVTVSRDGETSVSEMASSAQDGETASGVSETTATPTTLDTDVRESVTTQSTTTGSTGSSSENTDSVESSTPVETAENREATAPPDGSPTSTTPGQPGFGSLMTVLTVVGVGFAVSRGR